LAKAAIFRKPLQTRADSEPLNRLIDIEIEAYLN
tara:strand:+ start:188 stop:289 length:102 start_codon:yes stop_codon:yes gene_type:complete